MAERFNAAVLKTAEPETVPWVRIPLSPESTSRVPIDQGLRSKTGRVYTETAQAVCVRDSGHMSGPASDGATLALADRIARVASMTSTQTEVVTASVL